MIDILFILKWIIENVSEGMTVANGWRNYGTLIKTEFPEWGAAGTSTNIFPSNPTNQLSLLLYTSIYRIGDWLCRAAEHQNELEDMKLKLVRRTITVH